MPRLAVTLWIANIALDTAGHIAFKSIAVTDAETELARWRTMLAAPRLWLGVAFFCLEFAAWFALLSVISLSQAMLIGSIDIVAVMLAGHFYFREPLNRRRVAAMSLIAIGVALAGAPA